MSKKEIDMGALNEQILRAAKEVVVKFIETGRVSPTGFNETFKNVYRRIEETVKHPSKFLNKKGKLTSNTGAAQCSPRRIKHTSF